MVMKKQNSKAEPTPAIRPVAEMSEKQILAEKFKKQGLDCSVDSGIIRFYVGMEKQKEIESMLEKSGYDASWGIYPRKTEGSK